MCFTDYSSFALGIDNHSKSRLVTAFAHMSYFVNVFWRIRLERSYLDAKDLEETITKPDVNVIKLSILENNIARLIFRITKETALCLSLFLQHEF